MCKRVEKETTQNLEMIYFGLQLLDLPVTMITHRTKGLIRDSFNHQDTQIVILKRLS